MEMFCSKEPYISLKNNFRVTTGSEKECVSVRPSGNEPQTPGVAVLNHRLLVFMFDQVFIKFKHRALPF